MAATKTAREIFLAALDAAPADRAAYLNEACGADAAVRQRVEALLRANDDPGAFLSEAEPGVGDALPLPPAEAGDVTSGHAPDRQPETEDYGDPTARVGAVLGGKYKLIEEIGAGGMGSVFMAQQTEPVKRAVAVKVIKAGMDSKAVLVRFEAERQALAMMDHPNIARVLDAGTTDGGRPFFVMELVKGTPITQYCDDHKLLPRQRLELFVPVCLAIQHAHQKGIIHRDIKPSNVLVALYDDRPVPKVIDFGVAKAAGQTLTDKTLMTGFGTVVGTPEYMSPEQANLNNLDIDTRSDVYSLGVLLYELLTGSTPVDRKSLGKAALLEILRIVREVEAPRPSAKLSSSDALPSVAANRGTEPAKLSRLMKGELDWVLLKALEKDRTRRYDTANALSRDIQRYLADEVVEARPPSAGYRLKKFVRRHKGQVVAASLVLLALLAGMAGTTVGLIEARKQEGEARKQEGLAQTEAQEKEAQRMKAVAAGDELKKANAELTRSQADVLKSNEQLLSSVAWSLLRPLAVQVQANQPLPPLNDQEIEPLWDLASSPDERLRLRFVEVALHDPVALRRLKDRSAFALQAAVGLDQARRTQVEGLLSRRLLAREIPPEQREPVALCLSHLGLCDRALIGRTATTLSETLSKTTSPEAWQYLSQGLSKVSARLEPKEAAEAVATLTQAMTRTTEPVTLRYLAQGLATVAARLEPKEAAQACGQAAATLSQAIRKTTDEYALRDLAQGLSAVAARLGPKEAAEAAATLTHAITRTTDWDALKSLSEGLSAVSSRLEPKEAAEAVATLAQAIILTTNGRALLSLGEGLSAVSARLEPKEAAQAAATLTQAMTRTTNEFDLQYLAQGLAAVSARLEPKEAAQACGQAAATLTQAMTRTTDSLAFHSLYWGLAGVSARLEPKEAAQAAATLTQAMSRTTDSLVLCDLAQGLSAVSARLEPKEAAQVCGQAAATLTQAMTRTTDPFALQYLSPGLAAVSARLEPEGAAEAAATLSQAMTRTTGPVTLRYLSAGLAAVSVRLGPKEAALAFGQAAATLSQAIRKTTDEDALRDLALGLSAVSARLEPKEAAEVAATLIQAFSKATDWRAWRDLAQGLSVVSARLEPKEAAQAAAALTQAMTRTTDEIALHSLAQGLAAVAARLEPKQAAQACGQAVTLLTQAVRKTKERPALFYLWQGLSAVSARLEPKEAAATLTQAMSQATEPGTLRDLAQGLSAVSARLEPKQAAQACGQAAATLTQVIGKTTDEYALRDLAQGLSAVSAPLEPKEAAEAAATLTQAMTRATDPAALRDLSQDLSAVLTRQASISSRERLLGVTAMIAALGRPGLPVAALASAQPALQPLPPSLPPQMLVDLLKHPFCVGEARRLVLEQLARHYQRPFADKWDFVDYVTGNKLPLDLTTPPVRPRQMP